MKDDQIISKKLLSEVLGCKIVEININCNNVWHEIFNDNEIYCINIHELAHKCKEWAITSGYNTHSVRNLKEYVVYVSGDCKEPSDDFRCCTEPEAIFKACQWILKNKKDKR